MSTVHQILADALAELRIVDVAETMTGDMAESAIRALNRMMRRWEADGIALGWNDVALLSEDAPIPPEAEQAVIDNLAMMLRPQFTSTPDGGLVARAIALKEKLIADQTILAPLRQASPLRFASNRWNMYADEPVR